MSVSTLIIALALIGLAALATRFACRRARAGSARRHREAVIAQLREGVDRDSPIVGWILRDPPLSRKPARRVRDLH